MGDEWWDRLVEGWWPEDQNVRPISRVRDWLEAKRQAALERQPRRIGEIGVRAGYGAFALLSAVPDADFLGIDVDSPLFHTEAGSVDWAEQHLLAPFPHVTIIRTDVKAIRQLPPLDLLHIDGDHTFEGCTYDLELALRSKTKTVLVDDYFTGEIVPAAVDSFAERNGYEIHPIDDGFRGTAVIDLR